MPDPFDPTANLGASLEGLLHELTQETTNRLTIRYPIDVERSSAFRRHSDSGYCFVCGQLPQPDRLNRHIPTGLVFCDACATVANERLTGAAVMLGIDW